jgi:capsular polysaccharide transport system permease protein
VPEPDPSFRQGITAKPDPAQPRPQTAPSAGMVSTPNNAPPAGSVKGPAIGVGGKVPQGAGQQNGGQGGPGPKAGQPVRIRPAAKLAQMRPRHWGVLVSFAALVLLPLMLFAGYLWLIADDRYTSTVGFTVRQEEGKSGSDLLGGLANLAGTGSSKEGDILYEFIRSQKIVREIDKTLGLRTYFSSHWSSDPAFALAPNPTIEDVHTYWGRTVRVSYDQSSGLTELTVITFDPEMAQAIATEVVSESQTMVNGLNERARADAIRYADFELEQTQERLKRTRAALVEFRTRTQIVDLQADINARMGVVSNLQQRLAEELVAFDELSVTTSAEDPRYTQAVRRINVIRERIVEERASFANTEVLSTGEDYPTLISEFEGLTVEREFAEQAYRAALATRDSAIANATRQSQYLVTYISPTLAESANYPQRLILLSLAALFACLGWGIGVLVYYSIRDKA